MTSAYESGTVPPIELRHRLRIAREYAGLRVEELANIIGVSRKTISNAESGHVKPRPITLRAWAFHCGVPLSWIEANHPGNGGPDKPVGGPVSPRQPVGEPTHAPRAAA